MKVDNNIIKEKLIHKGAEANLIYGRWFDKEVIFKHRVPKNYRIIDIDRQIRTIRTLNEARTLIKVKNFGINVPQVYDIDTFDSIIIMKFINGEKLKNVLDVVDQEKKKRIFHNIGESIAKLHQNGHIHGDITTSNIIITSDEEIFLIDFGLHETSDTVEDKSVDLHLFKRVLISSHGKDFKLCFSNFLEGYRSAYEADRLNECETIIRNISIIETRGRYVKKDERL